MKGRGKEIKREGRGKRKKKAERKRRGIKKEKIDMRDKERKEGGRGQGPPWLWLCLAA